MEPGLYNQFYEFNCSYLTKFRSEGCGALLPQLQPLGGNSQKDQINAVSIGMGISIYFYSGQFLFRVNSLLVELDTQIKWLDISIFDVISIEFNVTTKLNIKLHTKYRAFQNQVKDWLVFSCWSMIRSKKIRQISIFNKLVEINQME